MTQSELKTDPQQLAWASPHLIYSAPSGVAQLAAGSCLYNAGSSLNATASLGAELIAQGSGRYHVKDGIRLFTFGSPPAAQSALDEQGLRLHAAAGRVSVQAQSDTAELKAKQDIRMVSTQDQLSVQASRHVLITVAGAYLKIEGSTVQLHAPGTVSLKGGKKVFAGPQSSQAQKLAFQLSEFALKKRRMVDF